MSHHAKVELLSRAEPGPWGFHSLNAARPREWLKP